jgi:4-hydroxybenzoate polyprenyltransferase
MDFLLAAVMLGTLYMSATCFNDIADEEIDKVNLGKDLSRPLITANVSSWQLRRLGILALVVAMLAALFIYPYYLLFVVGGITISVFYSMKPFKFSHRGIFASLWLSLSYIVLPFLAGAFIQGRLNRLSIYILVAMYLCFVGRVLLKDFRDYKGDKKFGKLNFLVRHGPQATCLASGIVWLLGDLVFIVGLNRNFGFLAWIVQPLILAIFCVLYILANQQKYTRQLADVLFIGRLGNSIALGLVAALTLEAYKYSPAQKNLIVLIIVGFTAISALVQWREDPKALG